MQLLIFRSFSYEFYFIVPTRFTIHIRITMEFALLFTRFEKKNYQNKNKKKKFPFFPHMQSAMVRQQCTYRIQNCCEI